MFKRLLLALLPLLAISCQKPRQPAAETPVVSPEQILYSLPTLCDVIPPTAAGQPFEGHRALHEDDWRQVEFVSADNREYLQAKLAEYMAFRESHRSGQSFTGVFIRPEHPVKLQQAGLPASELPKFAELPLMLGTATDPGVQRKAVVLQGFTLSDGGDWFLYGQLLTDQTVTALAVSPGHGTVPTERFVRALTQLAGTRLLLVDWYLGAVVDTTSPEAVLAWASRFK